MVKGQCLERISLTLMKRALQGKYIECPRAEEQIDGVQNKHLPCKNILAFSPRRTFGDWGSFLSKETHKTLQWYLHQTNIPFTISQQSQEQALNVQGIGKFEVEWHMAGDLKTLKCMFGCKLGATTMLPLVSTIYIAKQNQKVK